MLFTQTELESSHLESLKPAQRGAEEDCGKRGAVKVKGRKGE